MYGSKKKTGFVVLVLVAFMVGWYARFRHVVEPWIQFVRNIPMLVYILLVMVGAGVGKAAKVIVIPIAVFLVLTMMIQEIDGYLRYGYRTDGHYFYWYLVGSTGSFLREGADRVSGNSIAAKVKIEKRSQEIQ